MPLRRVVSIRYCILCRFIFGSPLPRTTRTCHQLPLVVEEVVEEAIIPFRWLIGPSTFQPASNCVPGHATTKTVLPSKALLLEGSALGLGPNVLIRISSTMGFTECVSTGNECNCFFIIHRHASECFSNVLSCSKWIRITIRPLRIYVDQSHLNSAKRVFQFPVTCVALIPKPGGLRSPVYVLFGAPYILTSSGETKRFETHRF